MTSTKRACTLVALAVLATACQGDGSYSELRERKAEVDATVVPGARIEEIVSFLKAKGIDFQVVENPASVPYASSSTLPTASIVTAKQIVFTIDEGSGQMVRGKFIYFVDVDFSGGVSFVGVAVQNTGP